jgi:hypothetical protein
MDGMVLNAENYAKEEESARLVSKHINEGTSIL